MEEPFDKKTKQLVKNSRRLTLVFWSFSVGISILLYIISTYMDQKGHFYLLVQRIAEILFGAAIITGIFNRVQEQQSLTYVREIIAHSVKEVFSPILSNAYSDLLGNYRWTCHLTLGDISGIDGIVKQNMKISYTIPKCPKKMKIVYGVSDKDGSLKEFYEDENCVLRWGIDKPFNHIIKPDNRDFFSLPNLILNGENLNNSNKNVPEETTKEINRGEAVIFTYQIPKNLWDKKIDLTLSFYVHKIIGNDSYFDVNSSFFRNVSDAELNLIVDKEVNVTKITRSTEVSNFLDNEYRSAETGTIKSDGLSVSSYIYLRFPIKKGSSFRFKCTRK